MMIDQAPGYYARALRVIGQDLADLIPENLTIELQGDHRERVEAALSARGLRSKRSGG